MTEPTGSSTTWWIAPAVILSLLLAAAVPVGALMMMAGVIAVEESQQKAAGVCGTGPPGAVYAADGPVRLPLEGKFKFTSEFGMRTQPKLGVYRLHAGIDLAMIPTGGAVLAPKDGTVQSVNYHTAGGGNYVVIDHGGGILTRYLHLSTISVKAGQKVQVGEEIAREGNTTGGANVSTGAHLHFEVKKQGRPIDAAAWLNKHGVDLPPVGQTASAPSAQATPSQKVSRQDIVQASARAPSANSSSGGFQLPAPDMSNLRHADDTDPRPIPAAHMEAFKAAEERFGVPWEVLAGVSMEETHHWSIQAVSRAGAMGPMQFTPPTWSDYGVDGDGDGDANIRDVEDAIHSAANLLAQSGGTTSPKGVRRALMRYNHARWRRGTATMFCCTRRSTATGK